MRILKTGVTDLLPVVSQTCTVPLSTFTNTILLSELDCLFISETANWAAFWTYESFKFFKGLGAPTNDARMGTHDPSRHKKNRDFCLTFMIPITVLGVDRSACIWGCGLTHAKNHNTSYYVFAHASGRASCSRVAGSADELDHGVSSAQNKCSRDQQPSCSGYEDSIFRPSAKTSRKRF